MFVGCFSVSVGMLFQCGIGFVDGLFQCRIGCIGGLFQCGKGCGLIVWDRVC